MTENEIIQELEALTAKINDRARRIGDVENSGWNPRKDVKYCEMEIERLKILETTLDDLEAGKFRQPCGLIKR